jgi:polysaccharide export outer membrane protein
MARTSLLLFVLVISFSSCSFYRRDLLFRSEEGADTVLIKAQQQQWQRVNFVVLPFDWIDVKVYSNGGESLVDPNAEFGKQIGVSVGGANNNAGSQLSQFPALLGTINPNRYLVNGDGEATLPLIGRIKLSNYTYRQVDSILSEKYSNYYEDAFVITRTSNRRCIVLTGGGGLTLTSAFTSGRVVPLMDEGISVLEAITLAGGVPPYTDMSKIKIIRGGNLLKPKIEVVNLQYVSTVSKSDTRVFPNDIVYIEPVRRPAIDLDRKSVV